MISVVEAHKRLGSAIARLAKTEGAVARRNARRSVGAAVRVLRAAVETEYPALVTRAPKRASSLAGLDPMQRANKQIRALERRGWKSLGMRTGLLSPLCAAAGIKLRIILAGDSITAVMAPRWVLDAGPDLARLRRAKHEPKYRAVVGAEAALIAMAPI